MRHETLNVGRLVVEDGVYDEDGNAIITDSATDSTALSATTSGITSNTRTVDAMEVTASTLAAGSSLTSAISNATASYAVEGSNLSNILSATQSGATDATNSTNVSTLDSEMSLVTSSAASALVTESTNASNTLLNTSSAASELAYRSSIVTNTAYDSSIVTNSTAISTGLNWDETASEFSSDVTAGSAIDSAGSVALQNNAIFGELWNVIGSAISSASA